MSTKRVMIVDDDQSIRETVDLILSDAGYSVTLAASGQESLEKLRAGFEGVVLMDVMMPQMDGWKTIAAIVDEGLLGGNVICTLTAITDPGHEMEGLKDCILDYVRKPFTAKELLDAVSENLLHVGLSE